MLAAAGSRDPDSAVDTRRTARLLSERLGGVPVLPAYASAASPSVPEALRALAARGRHRIAVASYFTAPGRFAAQSAAQAPWIAAAPLGAHPAMARLVLHRYDRRCRARRTRAAALHVRRGRVEALRPGRDRLPTQRRGEHSAAAWAHCQ